MTQPSIDTTVWWPGSLVLVMVGLMGALAGLVVGTERATSPAVPIQHDAVSINQCMTKTFDLLQLKQPVMEDVLDRVLSHCYSLARSENLMTDFTLRRLSFIQQYQDNAVLIWVVVMVTVCGVALAGIQLALSFRLALSAGLNIDSASEVILKRDQIVFKSSITGLFILLMSLGFFLVFVFYVFRLEKVDDDSGRGLAGPSNLPMGALGAPAVQQKPHLEPRDP